MSESLDTSGEGEHVGRKTRSGISWNLLGALVTNIMRVAAIAVLGRSLSSNDFGVVAAAVSVNAILHSVRDIGVGNAIIQRKQLDPAHVTTAFAFSIYLGLGMSIVLFAGAPLIGRLFSTPASVDVIRVLGLLFALRGLSTTSRMMAMRRMHFRAIALIESGAYAVGSIVSMALAISGAGPWSLVAGYLVEESLATALFIYTNPTACSLRIDGQRLRELLSFGGKQTFGQVIGTIGTNADVFVIGNALGAHALGFYTRAYDLIKLPSIVFGTVVGTVLFPAFSRLQDDHERLAAHYRRVTFLNALVLLPASAALIVLAPETIRILMGDGWDAAVLPFQILAAAMLMRTSQRLGVIVANAAGRAGAIAIAYTIYMVSVFVGALIAIPWGVTGVAVSTAIALLICYVACSYPAVKASRISVRSLLGAHVPGLALAVLVVAVALPLATVLRPHFDTWIVFAIASAAAVVTCGTIVVVLTRRQLGEFAWLRSEWNILRGKRGKR